MHISYHIFTFIKYEILLITPILYVSRSMAWNEEEAQNPFHLVIFKVYKYSNWLLEAGSTKFESEFWQSDRRYKEWCAAGGCIPRRDARGHRRAAKMRQKSRFRILMVELPLPHFRGLMVGPRADLWRMAPWHTPVPPLAYKYPRFSEFLERRVFRVVFSYLCSLVLLLLLLLLYFSFLWIM